jgi:hypothetical protein
VAGFCEHGDESSGSIKKAGYSTDVPVTDRSTVVFES